MIVIKRKKEKFIYNFISLKKQQSFTSGYEQIKATTSNFQFSGTNY